MAKYLFVYHGGKMAETEEEQQATMAAWGQWFGQLGDAIVDPGNPLAASATVDDNGASAGGGANPASGYSLINAGSLDEATEKAKGCPVIASGGSVEVAETIEIQM
jgi:hypothetical protein